MEIGFFLIKAQRYFEKSDNSYKHVFVLPLSLQNKKFKWYWKKYRDTNDSLSLHVHVFKLNRFAFCKITVCVLKALSLV